MTTPGGDGRRFAIYFAPEPDSPLHSFGSACLGRDLHTGAELPFHALDGLTADRWRQITASPRVYGFHATLKPPFRLAPGYAANDLFESVEQFAASYQPFECAPLQVARISNFLALVLQQDSVALSELASACVCHFDSFRASAEAGELARRKSAPLTPRQHELLTTWGYPYVLEEWRFHMTLASGLDRREADHLCHVLADAAAPACGGPLRVDAVCVFEQPAAGAPFQLTGRFPFGKRSTL